MAMALLGGALADRLDRRRLLLLDQIALVLCAGALAALAFAGSHAARRCCTCSGGLLAGFGAVQNVTRGGDRAQPRRRPSGCARRSRSTSASTS